MTSERLVAGLDIGTGTTTALIGEVVGDLPRSPALRVLGVGQARTTGLRRGVVADIEETARGIVKAMTDAERMAGAKVAEVYVGITGEHVQTIRDFLSTIANLQTIGRNGLHRYNNQDHSMLTGMLAVRNLFGETHDLWNVNTERSYGETVDPAAATAPRAVAL